MTTPDIDERYALSDNAIYSVYKDREGGMWVGSYFGGLNYYPCQYTYFEKYYPRETLQQMGRRVREFCAGNDGTLWFGTEDKGLFNFNPEDGKIKPFHHWNWDIIFMAYVWMATVCGLVLFLMG